MPRKIYDMQCKDCGYKHEIMKKDSEEFPKECPKCKSTNYTRLVGCTSFQLKGGGWFKDGY